MPICNIPYGITIHRYLREHPNEADGVDLAQFSFKIPMLVKEKSLEEHTTRVLQDGRKRRRMPWNGGRKEWSVSNLDMNIEIGYIELVLYSCDIWVIVEDLATAFDVMTCKLLISSKFSHDHHQNNKDITFYLLQNG